MPCAHANLLWGMEFEVRGPRDVQTTSHCRHCPGGCCMGMHHTKHLGRGRPKASGAANGPDGLVENGRSWAVGHQH